MRKEPVRCEVNKEISAFQNRPEYISSLAVLKDPHEARARVVVVFFSTLQM